MNQICLEIENLETLVAFIEDAKKAGFLKDIRTEQIKELFSKKSFPVRVPVDLNALLAVAGNPIVKRTFGKKIETKTVDILNQALRSG